jgi:hypothetical protein
MKRVTILRLFAVSVVLMSGLLLVFLFRGSFRRSSTLQQSISPAQILSSSASGAAAMFDACETCQRTCQLNCARYSDTPGTQAAQRCEDTCQIQCSDKCSDGGGKNKNNKKLKYKLRP